MAGAITGLHVFAADTGPEQLSLLDGNFNPLATALNALGSFSNYYVDSGGGSNTVVVTVPAPQVFALVAGIQLQIKLANSIYSGASAPTLNVNALGAVPITLADGTSIASGSSPWIAQNGPFNAIAITGTIIVVQYDQPTNTFRLISTSSASLGVNGCSFTNTAAGAGATAMQIYSVSGAAVGTGADLQITRNNATSVSGAVQGGVNITFNDLNLSKQAVIQYAGGNLEFYIAEPGGARVGYWNSGRTLNLLAPPTPNTTLIANGVSGATSGTIQVVSGNAGTVALADMHIDRAGSTANNYGQGPSLQFYDTTATHATMFQHSGGQTEIWQYETSWNQILVFNTAFQVSFPQMTTTASAANAFINNASSPANQLLRSTSSLRYKTGVRGMDPATALQALELRPIMYRSLAAADDPDLEWYGLAAEEVAAINPRLVSYDHLGRPDGVQYDRVGVFTLALVQQLYAEIQSLRGQLK